MNEQVNGEQQLPQITIAWDPDAQTIGIRFNTQEFKTWTFVDAILGMAERRDASTDGTWAEGAGIDQVGILLFGYDAETSEGTHISGSGDGAGGPASLPRLDRLSGRSR